LTTKVPAPLVDVAPESRTDDAPAILRLRRERPAGRPSVKPADGWYLRGKVVTDILLATLLTIPAIPLILLSALLVRLTSRGPAFYSQTRVGKGGRLFTIWKLRTMTHNAEALTGAKWCVPGDSRVTALGWFLRRTHIDELPQLWNVLRGEMSLIGPRPERPEFVPHLEAQLPAYRQRLEVRPGVSGLAQVQLPPDTDIDSVRRKLAHDLYYVRHLGLWMDVRLFICTAFYALCVPYRLMARLMGLPGSAAIEHAMRDVVSTEPIRPARAAA
jgi:lipopolysaccharide/colanic/teichoic acid biosynthesis glycosyltransferase